MGFSDKKYSALSQGSETSVGWHSRNLILGLVCCRKVSLTTYLWVMVSAAGFNRRGSSLFPGRLEFAQAYQF